MSKRRRKTPQRTCVGCGEVAPKRSMIRVVRTADAGTIELDPTGKRPGRGAYLHDSAACWQAALSTRRLAHALKTQLSSEEHDTLTAHMRKLAEASGQSDGVGRPANVGQSADG